MLLILQHVAQALVLTLLQLLILFNRSHTKSLSEYLHNKVLVFHLPAQIIIILDL